MGYRSRSKYTPGGGVLAFFEQVSRFVSLSVAVWIAFALFLILFFADGKVTDSFDLRLLRGVFSNGEIFLTSLTLLAISGLVGALVSIPASLVLFLSRQYLDFQFGRSGRRNSPIRTYLVKNLPVTVLVLSHLAVFSANVLSAPQVSRNFLSEGTRLSEFTAAGHFVLTSLTRRTAAKVQSQGLSNAEKDSTGGISNAGRLAHIILLPAEQMESEDFVAELAKLPDVVRTPVVISRSSVADQMETLLLPIHGPTAELTRKTLFSTADFTKAIKKNKSQTIISLSPQVRFGETLTGFGAQSLVGFNDSLLQKESQRRLVLSQIHLFGLFRLMDGVPFLGPHLAWLNLVADDIARLRQTSALVSKLDPNANGIVVVQLMGLEREFKSVKTPFRPAGWSLKTGSYESRMVNKNLVRELNQYLHDVGGRESAYWVVLPYADDQRREPLSIALLPSRSEMLKVADAMPSRAHIGALSVDFSGEIDRFLGESDNATDKSARLYSGAVTATTATKESTPVAPKLRCDETEVDFSEADFHFQKVDVRERGLGQLLNSLPLMADSDLSFLGKSMSNLISRDLGLGFLCRTVDQSLEEVYLLKYRGLTALNLPTGHTPALKSLLLSPDAVKLSESQRARVSKPLGTALSVNSVRTRSIRPEVIQEFEVLQLVPSAIQPNVEQQEWQWRKLEQREVDFFVSKFEVDALRAIELSARARIR